MEGRFKTRKIVSKIESEKFQRKGIFDQQYGVCFPTFFVKYDREYIKYKEIRLSIDTNIVYRSYKKNTYHSQKCW